MSLAERCECWSVTCRRLCTRAMHLQLTFTCLHYSCPTLANDRQTHISDVGFGKAKARAQEKGSQSEGSPPAPFGAWASAVQVLSAQTEWRLGALEAGPQAFGGGPQAGRFAVCFLAGKVETGTGRNWSPPWTAGILVHISIYQGKPLWVYD